MFLEAIFYIRENFFQSFRTMNASQNSDVYGLKMC